MFHVDNDGSISVYRSFATIFHRYYVYCYMLMYYVGIMLNALVIHYDQNYTAIISRSLLISIIRMLVMFK